MVVKLMVTTLAIAFIGLVPPLAGAVMAADKVYRIGYLTGASQSARAQYLSAFSQGMHELGYAVGKNLVLEVRSAEGTFERLPSLARELVRLNPDVLLVSTTPANLAAKAATATIPIVFVGVADAVGVGLVASLARPGGNITGITNIIAELTGKRLELLREIVPTASRIAILVNPDDPNASIQIRNAESAAQALKVQVHPVLTVRGARDLEGVFDAAVRAGAAAALRMADPTLSMLRVRTAELAAKHRLPVMYPLRDDVEVGGLVAYGPSLPAQYRQAASLVHKILSGAKPGDLPVEQPTKFELVINSKTANGLTRMANTMTEPEGWQVSGDAAEVYEKCFVPAILASGRRAW